ncbi:cation diffusion facilitator family transporter [Parelusimicrobium proximum]|uniref:cation diffusion facilitator family transporter n=1 Tax=Parelusimicrobium proximum TaxID=3228953 RepID=UPI003D17AF13
MNINPKDRIKEINRVTYICMAGNILLALAKLAGGILGRSAAMTADAMHSFSDLSTDFVLLFGVYLGNKPADKDHPYGHGKFETFTTLIIGTALLITAGGIFVAGASSALSILKGATVEKPGIIALVMAVISILSKEAMYQYTAYTGRKIRSTAVISNAWHHRSDALSSIATFIGIGGAVTLGDKWVILDPVAAMFVSFFILGIGLKVSKIAIEELLDGSLPDKDIRKIKNICLNVKNVKNIHEIKTRKIGYCISIAMHVAVEPETSFQDVHDTITKIHVRLKKEFGSQTLISVQPEPAKKKS